MGGGAVPFDIIALRSTFPGALDAACCGGAAERLPRQGANVPSPLHPLSAGVNFEVRFLREHVGLSLRNVSVRPLRCLVDQIPFAACLQKCGRFFFCENWVCYPKVEVCCGPLIFISSFHICMHDLISNSVVPRFGPSRKCILSSRFTRPQDSGFTTHDFRTQDSGLRTQGSGLRAQD